MKSMISIILFFSFLNASLAKTSYYVKDTLHWQFGYMLKPDDFMATPDSASEFKAITSVSLRYFTFYKNDTSLGFNVFCVFYKNLSWMKDKQDSTLLLSHEQGHFDIAEFFKRRLQKKFLEIESLNYKDNKMEIKNAISSIYNTIFKELLYFDNLYDLKTNHSINRYEQIKWNQQIKYLLGLKFSEISDTLFWKIKSDLN